MRILLLIFILHAVIYVHHMTNTVFLKVYLFVKKPKFPTVEIMTRRSVLPIRTLGTCRYTVQATRSFIFSFFLNVMAGNDNKRAVPYFCKHHLLAGLLF